MDNKKVENKKHMSNKKKFWVGMSALAAVGAITATVAYFYSGHNFNPDTISTLKYDVEVRELLDKDAAKKIVSGTTEPAIVSVTNKGDIPVLARVSYEWDGQKVKLGEENVIPGWKFNFTNGSKFLYNETEKAYYYNEVLSPVTTVNGEMTPGDTVQHLESIKFTGEDSETIRKDVTAEYTKDGGTTWTADPKDAGINGVRGTTTYSSASGELKVTIETLQATDKTGKNLTVPENATVNDLAGYWKELGKNLA